jgi:hypothetical protein
MGYGDTGVRSVGSIADRGNADAMGVAAGYDHTDILHLRRREYGVYTLTIWSSLLYSNRLFRWPRMATREFRPLIRISASSVPR